MRLSAISMISSCETEYGITKLKLLAAIESKNPDALNSCFYSCFFKNSGVVSILGLWISYERIIVDKHSIFTIFAHLMSQKLYGVNK